MSVDTTQQSDSKAARPDTAMEMLNVVHRHLVQIHAAMAERLSDDREIKPWAQRELMEVIREIGAFRRVQRKAGNAPS
jgi:hypothetical protein